MNFLVYFMTLSGKSHTLERNTDLIDLLVISNTNPVLLITPSLNALYLLSFDFGDSMGC